MVAAATACMCVCLPSAAEALAPAIYYNTPSSSGQSAIWRMNVDGSHQQQFVAGGVEPSWSADGSRMIYLANSTNPHCLANGSTGGSITLVGPDGQNPKNLTGTCGDARISPDGTHVAYEPSADQLSVVSVANPLSTVRLVSVPNVTQCGVALTSSHETACEFATEPSWSGSSTVVYSDDTSEGGLWSLPSAGGESVPTKIANGSSANPINYGISGESVDPGGTKVAVSASLNGSAQVSISVIPFGGSTGSLIASAPAGHSYVFPQWSPDGSTIVFEDDGPSNSTVIRTVPAGGGGISQPLATGRNPTFGPAPSTHKLTIRTLDEQFNAIPDENVHIAGPGANTTISTGPSGVVTLDEPPGAYTVQSSPADGTFKPVKSVDCTVQGLACAVNLDQDRSVTLQAPRDKLEFHFSPSSVNADGLPSSVFNGEVDDLDPTGAPVSGVSLKFTPPVESPKALVCSPTGLLYPQLVGNSIAFHPFRSTTAGDGSVHFTVQLGTEPGGWPLDAAELNRRVPAMGTIDLPFGSAPRRLPADLAQRIYDVVLQVADPNLPKQQIFALSGPGPFDHPAADQAVLLAFLGGHLDGLPDFGPIHTGNSAALEFYDATGRTAVLDTHVAKMITDDALNRRPLPANLINLPTLAQYDASAGVTTRGTLTPQPEGQLTYFGFPYPPLSQTGEVAASFFDQCLRPDALYYHVDVHSPVRLLFTDHRGRRFGLSASGKAVRGGPGLMVTDKAHHTTTFVIPADRYKITFSASGNGQATIVATTPGHSKERGQVVSFPVRKGQTGSASLGAGGLGGSVKFGGHSYKVAAGVGLRIHLSPTSLRHGSGTRAVKIVVSDQFGRALANAAVSVLRGKTTIANALTDKHGAVTVHVPRAKKGHVVVRVVAAASRSASATITII